MKSLPTQNKVFVDILQINNGIISRFSRELMVFPSRAKELCSYSTEIIARIHQLERQERNYYKKNGIMLDEKEVQGFYLFATETATQVNSLSSETLATIGEELHDGDVIISNQILQTHEFKRLALTQNQLQKSFLDNLPLELLDQIFSYLSNEDIQNAANVLKGAYYMALCQNAKSKVVVFDELVIVIEWK